MHSDRLIPLFRSRRCADEQRHVARYSSISTELPCLWLASARHIVAHALRNWRRGTDCDRVDRSTLRRGTKLVAGVAPGPNGLRQFSLSIAVVVRGQRSFDYPRLAHRGWLVTPQ